MSTTKIEILLFNLGNVIFPFDITQAFAHWSHCTGLTVEEVTSRSTMDAIIEQHDRGEISNETYHHHQQQKLGVPLSFTDLHEGYARACRDEDPAIRPLLSDPSQKIPLYAFSNTNALLTPFCNHKYNQTLSCFRRIFRSHEIGMRKPEPRAYLYVCREVGALPSRILFLDDTPANITVARELGWHAERVAGYEDIRFALRAYGIEREG